MIYQEIIFDSIFDIIKFKDLKLSLIFIFFIYLLYKTYINLSNQNIYTKIIITTSRFIVILCLLPLFLNKNYIYDKILFTKQNFGIIIDNSESMASYKVPILNIIDSINSYKFNYNVNKIYFNLDSIIDYKDIDIDKKYTNYNMFSSFVKKNDLDQIILLSDGNINYGNTINYNDFNKLNSFNIISFGNVSDNSISIKDVELINDKSQIISKTKFEINTQKKLISEFVILESNTKTILLKDTLYFNPGNYYNDLNYKLDKNSIDKNLTYKINPINFINNTKNQTKHLIRNKKQNIKILIITGALSYNTSFIKNLLNYQTEYDIQHAFSDKINANLNEYKLILIDNFYNQNNHLDIINDIYIQDIPVIVFDGVNQSDEFLTNLFKNVYDDAIYERLGIKEKKLILDDKIYGSITNNTDYFIENNNFYIDYYSNESISIIEKNNFVTVLVPNLGELDFYQKNIHNNYDLSDYFKFLIKRSLKENLLDLNVEKYSFFSNESITLETVSSKSYDGFKKYILINNLISNTQDTIVFNNTIYIKNPGKYEINLLFKGTNDILINSNKVSIEVLDDYKEKNHMFKNKELLTNICSNLNGVYINSEEFNSLYFENLNYDLKESNVKEILSALDIFINEYIYYLVIIFFSFEIYLRKRIGLL